MYFPCKQSPMLVRQVQPPHIYVRGDGRLNNTNRTNQSMTPLRVQFIPHPCTYASRSFVSRSSCRQAARPRGSRGDQVDLEQPIAAGFLRRGLSRGAGASGSQKAPAYCLAYRAGSRPPAGRVTEYLPRHRGYTRTCSCDAFLTQQVV